MGFNDKSYIYSVSSSFLPHTSIFCGGFHTSQQFFSDNREQSLMNYNTIAALVITSTNISKAGYEIYQQYFYILFLCVDQEEDCQAQKSPKEMCANSFHQILSIVGLGGKYSPATRMSRVRVPDDALIF